MIVSEINDKTVGFSVDDMYEAVIFEKVALSPISDKIDIITEIARDDSSGGMVIILDPEKWICYNIL